MTNVKRNKDAIMTGWLTRIRKSLTGQNNHFWSSETNEYTSSHDSANLTLVLDCSGSMAGGPINNVNCGYAELVSGVKEDTVASQKSNVQVIAAGGTARTVIPRQSILTVEPKPLTAGGRTPLAEAIEIAIHGAYDHRAECAEREVIGLPATIIVLSDGRPTDDHETIARVSKLTRDAFENNIACIVPFFTEGGDHDTLTELCGAEACPVSDLRSLFAHICRSVSIVSRKSPTEVTTDSLRLLLEEEL